MTQAEAWQAALEDLRGVLPATNYNTWIKPLTVRSIQGDEMVLGIESAMGVKLLRQRYTSFIFNAVKKAFGREYNIRIVNSADAAERDEPESDLLKGAPLNPNYTFDNFVVGDSNRFAQAASLAVAELPSEAYNPLFVYGGAGLGKTHLLHAIGNYILAENPRCNLIYMTSETFTNGVINAIATRKTQAMRDRLRAADVLMIDDIQFISGKASTQEEFFHTFNHLHASAKQIIITSDRPPKDIPTLEERLRTRFEWGLIADIQRPDYETRAAILRRRATAGYVEVPDEVINYIAEKVDSNIRELEGMMTRIYALANVSGSPVTLQMAEESVMSLIGDRAVRRVTPELIMKTVAEYYHVTIEDMTSKRRNREVAMPRQVAMFLTRELTSLSTTRIGEVFGGRDHTTVLHGCDKISAEARTSQPMSKSIEALRESLKNA